MTNKFKQRCELIKKKHIYCEVTTSRDSLIPSKMKAPNGKAIEDHLKNARDFEIAGLQHMTPAKHSSLTLPLKNLQY